jgi:hypothetical protein
LCELHSNRQRDKIQPVWFSEDFARELCDDRGERRNERPVGRVTAQEAQFHGEQYDSALVSAALRQDENGFSSSRRDEAKR